MKFGVLTVVKRNFERVYTWS